MNGMPATDGLRALDPFNAEWVTALLLIVFGALAWTNVSAPRKWRLLVASMFRMRLARQALREEIDMRDRTMVGLLAVAVAIMALFAWQALMLVGAAQVPGFPVLLGYVGLLLLGLVLLPAMVSALLRVDHGLAEYQATTALLFLLVGMVLLPVVVLLAYRSGWREGALTVGLVLVALVLLYRWVRAAWIGLGEGVPVRYIILYLCAAEMAPFLLLAAFVRRGMLP